MGCEKIMNRFLAVDGHKKLPSDVSDHIAICPRCAREVRNFEKSLALLSRDLDETSAGADLTAEVMLRIAAMDLPSEGDMPHFPKKETKNYSLRKWTLPGLFMLLGMFLTPFSTIFEDPAIYLGRDLEVYLHVILGMVISVYAGVFIVSHLDFLRDYFRIRNPGLPKKREYV